MNEVIAEIFLYGGAMCFVLAALLTFILTDDKMSELNEQVNTKITELEAAIEVERAQRIAAEGASQAAHDALQAEIDELRSQQTDGATSTDLQAILERLESVKEGITTIVPDAPAEDPSEEG